MTPQETEKPMEQKQKIMNIPNILSLLRMVLVPLCVAAVLYMPHFTDHTLLICLIPSVIFALTALTDMLDGKIARKHNLITDFGKFIDPLADKFMVFGLLVAILASPTYGAIRGWFIWVTVVVMLRELGVTSLRLVVASRGTVNAASWWGKIKTVTQIVSLIVILMEPALTQWDNHPENSFNLFYDGHILAGIGMVAIVVTTLGSGIDYLVKLWPYIAGEK